MSARLACATIGMVLSAQAYGLSQVTNSSSAVFARPVLYGGVVVIVYLA